MVATRKMNIYRGVAQFGRVLGSGPRGRRFKSSHSDQQKTKAFCLRFLLQEEDLKSSEVNDSLGRLSEPLDLTASSRENQILSLRFWVKMSGLCCQTVVKSIVDNSEKVYIQEIARRNAERIRFECE